MIQPEIGEICLLADGRSVQVLIKLGYGLYLCWIEEGEEFRVEILNIVELYGRTNIIHTRPSVDDCPFELN